MNYVGSNNISFKYQRFTSSGSKDMGIRKFKFVAKTPSFLLPKNIPDTKHENYENFENSPSKILKKSRTFRIPFLYTKKKTYSNKKGDGFRMLKTYLKK